MRKRLISIMSEALSIDITSVNESLSTDNCKNWDSLASVGLILKLESEFNVTFTLDELSQLNSYKQILNILIAKGVK